MFNYDSMEIMVTPNKKSQDAEQLKDLMDQHSTPISSIHTPTALLRQFTWGAEPVEKLRRSAELAQKVGATSVVIHPPFKSNPYAKKFLATVNSLEQDTGINFAIENMFPWGFRKKQIEMHGPSWQDIADNASSLTLDFSHAAASGLDVLAFVRDYHEKIKVIHFCDGTSRAAAKNTPVLDEHLLPGNGDMPLVETYEFLNQVGWKGSSILEVNTVNQKTVSNKRHPIGSSMSYFRSL